MTAEQIRQAAAAYLHPNNVELVVTGNARFLYPELYPLGTVDMEPP